MKIAQIAPLMESVPPKLYGGTERIVAYIADELVRQGHEVTLFASADSATSAELVPICETALRLDSQVQDTLPHHLVLLDEVRRRAAEFDILHFHIDLLHGPLVRTLGVPTVTTLHGRLDLPDLQPYYRTFGDLPLVSISNDQRRPLPPVNWAGTVHHGLPRDLLTPTFEPKGDYLAFLGRISPEKRPDRAIAIAAAAGMKLRIAAKIDKADQRYWDDVIAPMVRAYPDIEFVGEIGEAQKADFLGNARALLFPIDWPEPFGLVMIEAMACATPTIAFRCGSVPEVIDEGESGFIVDNVEEAVEAVGRLDGLDRRRVRQTFDRRFTAERMVDDYLSIYRELSGVPAQSRPMRLGADKVDLPIMA
ncbi:glycosyltransferase family 4 protein [Pelagerythrobacter marensis]|uniref:Glycosyltransferase family 4 protein n=1 Tax=Pelagerythrobacter marensis TaxID=543877 RepID=A0ABZ2D8R4_9SPHN